MTVRTTSQSTRVKGSDANQLVSAHLILIKFYRDMRENNSCVLMVENFHFKPLSSWKPRLTAFVSYRMFEWPESTPIYVLTMSTKGQVNATSESSHTTSAKTFLGEKRIMRIPPPHMQPNLTGDQNSTRGCREGRNNHGICCFTTPLRPVNNSRVFPK
ncbi:hypothetical protein BDV41DRAFT_41566 [Aspergillus transmontanensis]|uniref:Uncharacterized protein n=1 Tax=Aspergillus transmontanensis TaxID=1034304 RepID=A0A5N6VHK8_9EURO|nr:hypothetical protein BDV41DRAFT_41566 [Aspergillus transmontanensis]